MWEGRDLQSQTLSFFFFWYCALAQYNIYIQFVYTAAQASTVDFQTL